MSGNQRNTLFLMGLVVAGLVRGIHTGKHRDGNYTVEKRTSPLEWWLTMLWGVGTHALPLLYMRGRRLHAADYRLRRNTRTWTGIAGAGVFTVGIWLLWRSHVDLGRSWTPTLAIREKHQLVTDGVYRYVRHPMYAAHALIGVAQALLLQNWIIGFAGLASFVPLYMIRVDREEQMMRQHFGNEYARYMERTDRIFPNKDGWEDLGLGGRSGTGVGR